MCDGDMLTILPARAQSHFFRDRSLRCAYRSDRTCTDQSFGADQWTRRARLLARPQHCDKSASICGPANPARRDVLFLLNAGRSVSSGKSATGGGSRWRSCRSPAERANDGRPHTGCVNTLVRMRCQMLNRRRVQLFVFEQRRRHPADFRVVLNEIRSTFLLHSPNCRAPPLSARCDRHVIGA
jgi:hypothetical protein